MSHTHPINKQLDFVPDFQRALNVTNVKDIASTHLHILHGEFHFL